MTITAVGLRPELGPLPERMRDLPIDHERGYVIPWFVAWVNGKPEFRAMDQRKWIRAVRESLCWVGGKPMGTWKVFVAGGMCGVSRTSSEPPSHLECARWSARNCPFLSRPHMVRREDETINSETLAENTAGVAITRNPGVAMLWTTKKFEVFRATGGLLIEMGEPERVEWWACGRAATLAEVKHSIETGLPSLVELALKESGGVADLERRVTWLRQWLPQN